MIRKLSKIIDLHADDIECLLKCEPKSQKKGHGNSDISTTQPIMMPQGHNTQLIVIYGSPSYMQIKQLVSKYLVKHILIFDPYHSLFLQRIHPDEWVEIVNQVDVRFILCSNSKDALQRIEDYFIENIDRFISSAHCSHALVPGYEKNDNAKKIFSDLSSSFKMASDNIINKCKYSKEDSFFGLKNTVINLNDIDACRALSGLKLIHKGIPIAVVAPGPSLEKSIHTLKSISSRVIIVSCEAAIKILSNYGIKADYACVLERCVENVDMLSNLNLTETHLIITPLVHPTAMQLNTLSKIVAFRDVGSSRWFYPSEDYMFLGQTVSQMALTVAAHLGGSESSIYLFGVDCAYDPNNQKSHHSDTHQLAHIQSEMGTKLETVNVLTNYTVSGYLMQDVLTNNQWLTDSVVISQIIKNMHLNVIRVSSIEYGFHIDGVKRIDPENLSLAPTQDIVNLATSVNASKCLLHDRKAAKWLSDIERAKRNLCKLKNGCVAILAEITDFYYGNFPIYQDNQIKYDDFFNQLVKNRSEMLNQVLPDYFGLIHPILQGDYALFAYQERCQTFAHSDQYSRIEERLKLHRSWFAELLCWTVRIEYLLSDYQNLQGSKTGRLNTSGALDEHVIQ